MAYHYEVAISIVSECLCVSNHILYAIGSCWFLGASLAATTTTNFFVLQCHQRHCCCLMFMKTNIHFPNNISNNNDNPDDDYNHCLYLTKASAYNKILRERERERGMILLQFSILSLYVVCVQVFVFLFVLNVRLDKKTSKLELIKEKNLTFPKRQQQRIHIFLSIFFRFSPNHIIIDRKDDNNGLSNKCFPLVAMMCSQLFCKIIIENTTFQMTSSGGKLRNTPTQFDCHQRKSDDD